MRNGEGQRKVSDHLTVEFIGNRFLRTQGERGGLEIFDISQAGLIADQNGVHVPEQIPRTLILKKEDIQHAVVERSLSEHLEGTAVETAVSEQDERPGPHRSVSTLQRDGRGLLSGNLRKGKKIAQRAKGFLGFPRGSAHHLGIQSDTCQLDKTTGTRTGKVQMPHIPRLDHRPGFFKRLQGNTEFRGKHIHRPHG